MQNFVVFDIETTGLGQLSEDIIEIGALKCDYNSLEVFDSFTELVKPTKPISSKIHELTGLTSAQLSDKRSVDEVLPDFYKFCEESILVGYNLSFDYGFLGSKGRVLGIDFSLNGKREGLDVLQVVRRYGHFVNNKLQTVADALDIHLEDGTYHRALYDTRVALEIMKYYPAAKTMITQLPKVNMYVPDEGEGLAFE